MQGLRKVYLKIDRAAERSAALTGAIAAFCREHPITFRATLRQHRLGVDLVCDMGGVDVPLDTWSVELGEIAHLLRSALDNLVFACAQTVADPPVRPRDLQFPIVQAEAEYSRAVRNIESQLPTSVAELLRLVQPFQRARPDVEGSPEADPLVLLHWISNQDKHRTPVPFLVPPRELSISNMCQFASDEDAAANVPPDVTVHAGPLSHGKVVLEYKTKHPIVCASGELKVLAHVEFESHAGPRQLPQAVGQLVWYTRLVVDEFAKRISND